MELRYNKEVTIPVGKIELKGELVIPFKARAIIIFSHGSGSSRHSPRNVQVARYLHEHFFGTLLFDLLTEDEDRHYLNRFNIDILTSRLSAVTEWLEEQPAAQNCSLGYFGASTGAASALRSAAALPRIGAVVSRGGRPDLVPDSVLARLDSPVLLLVGGLDYDVLQLNRQALGKMTCIKKMETVPGATHLFEEQGAMEKVCELATDWFEEYLLPVKV